MGGPGFDAGGGPAPVALLDGCDEEGFGGGDDYVFGGVGVGLDLACAPVRWLVWHGDRFSQHTYQFWGPPG